MFAKGLPSETCKISGGTVFTYEVKGVVVAEKRSATYDNISMEAGQHLNRYFGRVYQIVAMLESLETHQYVTRKSKI